MGPSEKAAARMFEILDALVAPLLPENYIIEQARARLQGENPTAPTELGIRYAVAQTDSLMRDIKGPLAPLTRRILLEGQLSGRARRYLMGLTKFYQLGEQENLHEMDIDTGSLRR